MNSVDLWWPAAADLKTAPLRNAVSLAALWLLLWAAAVLIYAPGLHATYFSDDFQFFFDRPPAHLYQYFFERGIAPHAYRPLEAIVLTVIQGHYGFETMPLRLLELFLHAGTISLVAAGATRLGFSRVQTVCTALLLLVSQGSASALLGNDTLSQTASVFFGVLASLALYEAVSDRDSRHRYLSLACATLSYTLSIFSKETGLGYLLVLCFVAVWAAAKRGTWLRRFVAVCALSAPFLIATGIYLAFRLHAGGPLSGGGPYRLSVGPHVASNLIEFFLVAFSPLSTVTTALALVQGEQSILLLALSLVGLAVACVLWSAWQTSGRILAAALVLLGVAALFPSFLLSHVSELYVYNALPFFMSAAGLGLGGMWVLRGWRRVTVILTLGLMMIGNVAADRQKAELMAANGRHAAALLQSLSQYVHALPPDSEVYLVRAPVDGPQYSTYVVTGLNLLEFGDFRLGPILGRPDVQVKLVMPSEAMMHETHSHLIMLQLRGNALVPFVGGTIPPA